MAKLSVENLLKEKRPYGYCFEFECDNDDYIAMSTVERYLVYKSVGKKIYGKQAYLLAADFCLENQKKYPAIADCDGSDGKCELAIDIYKKLWNWKNTYNAFGKIEHPHFKGDFGGDTMNSMQTVMNFLVQYIAERPENSDFLKSKRGNYSLMYGLELLCKHREEFLSNFEYISGFKSFANNYHTLGNFVLVPKYFNCSRYGNTFDFWDSSLVWLKKDGFTYKDEKVFDKEMFNKYINYFYLWDYVSVKNINGEMVYIVNPLFESHYNIENGSKDDTHQWGNVKSYTDLKQFLRNSYGAIRKRGIFMTILLTLKNTTDEALKEVCKVFFSYIQSEEFLSNVHEKGFEEVTRKLLNLLEKYNIEDNSKYDELWKEIYLLIYEGLVSDVKSFTDDDLHTAWNILQNEFLDDLIQFAVEKDCMTEKMGEAIYRYGQPFVSDFRMISEINSILWEKLGLTEEIYNIYYEDKEE